jgi:carboxylesterase
MTKAIEGLREKGNGERRRIGIGLIHGFTGNPTSTKPTGEALWHQGFTVDVPRLPGHGTRWQDMRQTDYGDWVRRVHDTVDWLRANCDIVILGGLSMGGTLSIDVATERVGDVSGVVTVNLALLDREGFLAKLSPYVSRLIPVVPAAWAGLAKNDIAKGGDERAYAYVPARAGVSFLGQLPRIREKLPTLVQPLLVAYSPDDHSVPPKSSRALLHSTGSRDVIEVVLTRSFHVATLDYDAPRLESEIASFALRVEHSRQKVS